MAQRLTIGKLAAAADVPVSTVRYYERTGLIHPTGRTAHNYRCYDRESVERLRFIKAAQAGGFSLHDIASLLKLRDRDTPPCQSVRDMIDQRLATVRQQIDDLQHVRRTLEQARRKCEMYESAGVCGVLSGLDHVASTGESSTQ